MSKNWLLVMLLGCSLLGGCKGGMGGLGDLGNLGGLGGNQDNGPGPLDLGPDDGRGDGPDGRPRPTGHWVGCRHCGGDGKLTVRDGTYQKPCATCNGDGRIEGTSVIKTIGGKPVKVPTFTKCNTCGGDGKITTPKFAHPTCTHCNGKGKIWVR